MSGGRILLIGSNGQVGWELCRTLAPLGQVVTAARSGAAYATDLTDFDRLRSLVRDLAPTLIVNAAAYTAVDQAEQDEATAFTVNAAAPGLLAEEARRLGALLVHYSTDYVFDGSKGTPYRESDAPAPLNAYGRTKLAGEDAVCSVGGDHLILRTAWVYGLRGRNFLLTMLRLAHERERLQVVDDQFGTPNWSRLLAEATALAIARGQERGRWRSELSGSYHLSCDGEANWYEFAATIFSLHRQPGEDLLSRLYPISSIDYPTLAKRPKNSILNASKLAEAFGVILPHWTVGLTLCLQDAGAGDNRGLPPRATGM